MATYTKPSELRPYVVAVRLTEAEYEQVSELARELDRSRGATLRLTLREYLRADAVTPESRRA